ncbi:MAG: hypothetical protein A2033_18245 [Bacteroidetes bacterium GWA2_31_9]|nr:MAG: hypothetical protein A2033_18245 [Bacteroidetes bacterium GWA2_31_9]
MKYIQFIIIVFCGYNVLGQTIKFNKTYSDTLPVARNIFEISDGYYLLGGSGYQTYILISKIDTLGNEIWQKKIKNSSSYLYHGVENSLKRTLDNKYILGGSSANIYSDSNSVFIAKFDSNLDTIWSKRYFIDTMQSILYGSGITKNNEYLFVGVTTLTDPYGNVLLFKTDLNGVILWYKEYGNNLPNNGYKVVETWDNGYLIGGWTNNGVYTGYSGEWYLIKTDSMGNLKWQKNLGNPSYNDGRVCGLLPTKDSCYIVTGSISMGLSGGEDVQRSRLIKIDTYGNIKWDKRYDYTGIYSTTIDAIEQSDGSIIALSYADSAYIIHTHQTLQKLTPNGDLIWRKRIWFMCDSFNCYEDNGANLVSLIQTSDGGFAMAGWVFPSSTVSEQSMWVIKTDSLGNTCFPDSGELGCMTIVTIEETPTEKGNANINVFPNPSASSITIDIQKAENEQTSIEILSLNGSVIYKNNLPSQQTKQNIDISSFSKGVYFVTVKSSTFTETRKLIIQ